MRAIKLNLVRVACLVALSYVSLGVLSGCGQRNLFSETETSDRLKYWDNDSAVQTRESRQHSSEMGFGMSNGAASQ